MEISWETPGDMTVDEKFQLAYQATHSKLKTYVRNCYIPGVSPEDLTSELLWELYRAVLTYNPVRGSKFNTYLQRLWKQKIYKLKRAGEAQKRVPVDRIISIEDDAFTEAAVEKMRDELSEILEIVTPLDLSETEAAVVVSLAMGASVREIADESELSQRVVRGVIEGLGDNWDLYRSLISLRRAG